METNNTPQNKENKKLIIICATTVIVAALALVTVLVLKSNSSKSDFKIYGDLSEFTMTYDDFTYGMKEDLPADVEEQIKNLYDEFLVASENSDDTAMIKIFDELDKLDVYDEGMMENMGGVIELTPQEMAELDSDGDGVIVFEDDELPAEFDESGGN